MHAMEVRLVDVASLDLVARRSGLGSALYRNGAARVARCSDWNSRLEQIGEQNKINSSVHTTQSKWGLLPKIF